jgi:hypothetical protein
MCSAARPLLRSHPLKTLPQPSPHPPEIPVRPRRERARRGPCRAHLSRVSAPCHAALSKERFARSRARESWQVKDSDCGRSARGFVVKTAS